MLLTRQCLDSKISEECFHPNTAGFSYIYICLMIAEDSQSLSDTLSHIREAHVLTVSISS